jgi:ribonuclease P protein component
MLKKRERLTTAAFNRSFSSGRRYHSPALTIIYDPATDFHGAAVVGKKVYKTAVARNRLRRQLYSALYRWQQQSGAVGTFIIIAKPALRDVPQRQVAVTTTDALQAVQWRHT